MAPTECTPLADLNGRARFGLVTPSKKPTVVNDNEESWTITAASAKVMREKLVVELPEQRRRAAAAEEKVASQDKLIEELQNALASARADSSTKERKQVPEKKEEKTLELASVRVELHQAQKLLEFKESTIDRLIPQVVANSMHDKEGVRNMEAEIERLRRELDNSRAEVAQIKPELRDTQQRLDMAEAELDRVLPGVVADRIQGRKSIHGKDAELAGLRRELESARTELADKKLDLQLSQTPRQTRSNHLELQQALQDLEYKNEEVCQLRRELENARAELGVKHRVSQVGRGANPAELQRALQDLEFKTGENEKLCLELDASRAECSRHLIELHRLRSESKLNAVVRTEAKVSDYENMLMEEQRLSNRSMELQQRELAVAKSEGFLGRREFQGGFLGRIEPVTLPMRTPPVSRPPTPRRIPTASRAPTPPLSPRQDFYRGGGSGIPGRQNGLWDRLGF